MENKDKLLKKLGFDLAEIEKEDFDLDTTLNSFHEKQFDVYKNKTEVKEMLINAKRDGEIVATKKHKKIFKKFDIDVDIENGEQTIEDLLTTFESKLKVEPKDNKDIEKYTAEIDKWKQKYVDANDEIGRLNEAKIKEIETVKSEFETKFKQRDKVDFLKSDLSKIELVIDNDVAFDLLEAKLQKMGIDIEVVDGKPVLKKDGKPAMNENETSFLTWDSVRDSLISPLKKQSNGGSGEPITFGKQIEKDKMTPEVIKMLELAENM